MSSYVSPLLFRFNKINGRGNILYGKLTEALAGGTSSLYYSTSSPLGLPDLESTHFLHSSLPFSLLIPHHARHD